MKRVLVGLMVLAVLLGGCVKESGQMLLYIADYNNLRVMIIDSDMNYVDQFNVPDAANVIAVDSNYIYAGTYAGTQIVYKFNKTSPYGQVASGGPQAGFDMDEFGPYLYLAEVFVDAHIYIINKSDCSVYGKYQNHDPEGIAADDTYIYVSTWDKKLKKFWNIVEGAGLVTSVDITAYGGMAVDDNYVYLARWQSGVHQIDIFNKSDLSVHGSISPGGSGAGIHEYRLTVEGDYAYVSHPNDHVVRKIKISTNTVVATFGVAGVSGSDTSHLNSPRDIAFYLPSVPTAPTDLLTNGQTNPVDVIPSYFSAIYHGGYTGKHYQIQVNKQADFAGTMMWNSGKTAMSDVADTTRCDDIYYNGQALSLNKLQFYWRIKFWDNQGDASPWSAAANFTMAGSGAGEMGAGPWGEDVLEPSGEVKVEIPRRSGQWTTLEDIMRIHTSVNKNPLDAIEIAQAEVTCSNISKNFNSFEEASNWYKQLEGYAVQLSVGCKVGDTPISRKLFTGIISSVEPDRISQTVEIRVVDFLNYFGRVTIKQTPVWQNISLTQLYKNLVELAFSEWVEGVDYFVEDLGDITVEAIGYENLNLLSELKHIAESRGMRIFTDVNGKLVCRSRGVEGGAWDIRNNYNLEAARERRDIDNVFNWIVVHARPHEIAPDLQAPGKIAGFTAAPVDSQITLTWSNPTDEDFELVRIQYSTTNYPLNPENGITVYQGSGQEKVHSGLTNGTKYYYSAFTKDTTGNWSEASRVWGIPTAGAPPSPTVDEMAPSRVWALTAIPEHSKIILTWYNPNSTDFELVRVRSSATTYPSSPTSGNAVYEGTGNTTIHSGLINGKRYYYSAFVKNTAGQWSSAAFASAVPAGLRTTLSSQSISGGGCLVPDQASYDWAPHIFGCACFGTDGYSKQGLRLSSKSRSENWLRFKHEWDIQVRSAWTYASNEKHEIGVKEDLGLSFSHSCGGVASVVVTKISVTAAEVRVQYKIVYTGGKAARWDFRNKLSLMG